MEIVFSWENRMASLKNKMSQFASSENEENALTVYGDADSVSETEEVSSTSGPGLLGRLFRLSWNAATPSEHDKGRELRRAVRAEDVPKIKKMLQEGVGVNESQEASLACIATRRRNLEVLNILIQAGVDINQGDRRNKSSRVRTPLQESARKGWIEGVEALLKAGAKVDLADDSGATALFLAIRSNQLKVAEILLKDGASVNGHPDRSYQLPIHEATSVEAVELLIKYGADIESKDRKGRTAFLIHAKEGRLNMLKFLAEKGANINAMDTLKRNALFLCGERGDTKGVYTFLLSSGVQPRLLDLNGNNFLHFAVLRANDVKNLKWLKKEFPALWKQENLRMETPSIILTQRNFLIDLD